MSALICLYMCLYLFRFASSSTLTAPPLSVLIIAFENINDLSLLANTLSDADIDTTLIIPSYAAKDVYNHLIDVEVLKLDIHFDNSIHIDTPALKACNSLLSDEEILKKIQEFQPTFTIFPALRHDGCLLPFVKHIGSIPVIWINNPDEELYVFERTGVALPVHSGGFWSRISTSLTGKSISSAAKNSYTSPALRLATKYLPYVRDDLEHLYSDVRLVLWGADSVLRSNFAYLTPLLVEIGCHHCRGVHSLPGDLQKSLVEHRMGTIIALLDENYEMLIRELAEKLPHGREGQALVWKVNDDVTNVAVENLFIRKDIDRQDLIGYSRTRVVLSHCTDTEFLEAAFHRTPLICLPRDTHESRNAARAVELGFARSIETTDNRISAAEVADMVRELYETTAYHDNARMVSVAMRDKLNPPSDKLVYWLGYIARTRNDVTKFYKTKTQTRTLTEDIQFFVGLLIGIMFGIVSTGCTVLARYLATKAQVSKGRYAQ